MKKTKNNIIFIIVLIIVICLSFFINRTNSINNEYVNVYVNNKLVNQYNLKINKTVKVNNTNTFIISDKKVWMKESTCTNKICIHQGKISKNGEMIVCLPNEVILKITSDKEDNLDAKSY
ncbi:MAG: NusG domain II-containing protein [Thomasclavelia sp.]|nr:NusG domain II-containing protein [Thomasclavelia sp.]